MLRNVLREEEEELHIDPGAARESDVRIVQAEELHRVAVEEEVGRRELVDGPGEEGTVLAEDLGCIDHRAGEVDSDLEGDTGQEEDTVLVEGDSDPEEGDTVRNLVVVAVLCEGNIKS